MNTSQKKAQSITVTDAAKLLLNCVAEKAKSSIAKTLRPDNFQFKSKVAGIPCIIEIIYYSPGTNFLIHSQSLEPNDDPEFEFDVLDRKGYRAAWLERKLTDDDKDRIWSEYLEMTEDDRY